MCYTLKWGIGSAPPLWLIPQDSGMRFMAAAHQPTRRNWTVFASWRESRFVASAGVRVSKASFDSPAVVFGSFNDIIHV